MLLERRSNPAGGLKALAVLLCLLFAAGCGGIYVDPGHNPARVKLSLKAEVKQQAVNQGLYINGYGPDSPMMPPFGEISGPFWNWGLYLVGEDGSLTKLRSTTGAPGRMIASRQIAINTELLAPQGKREYLLLVEVSMLYQNTAGLREYNIKSIGVATLKEKINLDTCAGCRVNLDRSIVFDKYGVFTKPPQAK